MPNKPIRRANARVDVADEFMASLEEGLAILKGEAAPARTHAVTVPDIDVAAARARLGMSQDVFAATFGVSVATLRKWEQHQRRPGGAARVLLRVIEHDPAVVQRALAG